MTESRKAYKSESNNRDNMNQNICALAVAEKLGVSGKCRYLHTISDLVNATRKLWTVRSRRSAIRGETIGKIRESIRQNGDAIAYIVRVPGHVILLNRKGDTIVDTAPRKRDRRKVTHIYGVYK